MSSTESLFTVTDKWYRWNTYACPTIEARRRFWWTLIYINNRKWLAHTVHRLRSTESSCTSKHPGPSNIRDTYIVFIAWAWWTGDFNTVHIKLVCHKLSLSASCSGNFYCAGQDHRYASRNSCIRRVHCQCRLSGWNRHNTQNYLFWSWKNESLILMNMNTIILLNWHCNINAELTL